MNRRKNAIPTYTKHDIAKLAAKAGNSGVQFSTFWVDKICDAIKEIMMSADPELRIEIRHFGVFEVKITKPKPAARNPKTGEIIYVPARRKTRFKPGKPLRKFLSGPLDESG